MGMRYGDPTDVAVRRVQVYDEYPTTLRNDGTLYYIASTGNAPKVEVKGVELDGVYAGLPNATLRFAGSYNDAKYKGIRVLGTAGGARQPDHAGWMLTPSRIR